MDEVTRPVSYGLAVDMANEWEHKAREYKKTHKKAVTHGLFMMMRCELEKMTLTGTWNATDVAGKACEILAERLGERFAH